MPPRHRAKVTTSQPGSGVEPAHRVDSDGPSALVRAPRPDGQLWYGPSPAVVTVGARAEVFQLL